MKLTDYAQDFKTGSLSTLSNDFVGRFVEWSQELIVLMNNRVHSDTFVELVKYMTGLDGQLVTRMTDAQLDEQLVFCSQHKFVLAELRDDLEIYNKRVKNRFDFWYAEVYTKSHEALLVSQRQEITDGIRLKSAYDKQTKEDLKNYVMVHYKNEYEQWLVFMEGVERSVKFVTNLVSDLESRSWILMSIGKRRN